MNLAQAETLATVARQLQPLVPLYHEEGDPKPTTRFTAAHNGTDRLELSWILSPETSLVRYPRGLAIDDAGVLVQYDEDQDKDVPVMLRWRYGHEGREQHYMICEAFPVEQSS